MKLLYIDLFCGAGGTSTGVETARIDGKQFAKVIACVNHDANAIASHAANHPDALHFTEDIRKLELTGLLEHIDKMKNVYPEAKVVLWISAECTSHSNAKGGTSRDADSRSLPEEMYRYILAINPDVIQVENVKEFLEWGPLIIKVVRNKKTGEELYCPLDVKREKKKGQKEIVHLRPTWMPDPRFKTTYYNRWINEVQSYGYHYDYKVLDAADYGARTNRKRYFGIFAKDETDVIFPLPTHSKDGKTLLKWKPVKEVLDFSVEGESIFGRKKDLSEKTLARIYAGLIRFVAGGKDSFLIKWNSMKQNGNYNAPSVDEPSPTVTCQNRLGVAKVQFLSKYFSGNPDGKNISVEAPAGTITTVDHHSLVEASFLSAYYGNGHNHHILKPSPTLTTKDRLSLITAKYMIDQQYGQSKPASIEVPCNTITANPKYNLVEMRCKKPPHLVTTIEGQNAIVIYENDSEMTKKIKEFMAMYNIVDILMRMLLIKELKAIMGFSKEYKLIGTQTEQKKYIGNAVEVKQSRAFCLALGMKMIKRVAV